MRHTLMGNLAGEMNLSLKAIERPSIIQQLTANGFESYALVQLYIFRFVNFAHASTGHEACDAESLGNQIAGKKRLTLCGHARRSNPPKPSWNVSRKYWTGKKT